MKRPRDQHQTSQRLRVALVGLVLVSVLIRLASLLADVSPSRDPGGRRAVAVAADEAGGGEPLAQLGATPGTVDAPAR